MKAGHTHYTAASGIPELKKAVAEQYQAAHGLEYDPAQVVVSNGAKHALHNVFTVLLDPGDEVIIPAPYWVSYAELVKLTGAVPVIVQTRAGRRLQAHARAVPRGDHRQDEDAAAVQPVEPDRQHVLARGAGRTGRRGLEKDLLVVADEIYERLVYAGHTFASFATRPARACRTARSSSTA